jgi:uncharacterized membrane protein
MSAVLSAVHQPTGAAFDVVLILHVGCVLVGLATVIAAIAAAGGLRSGPAGAPPSDAVARYFRPGINWAGRTLWGIPVFGFILLAMSHGAYSLHDGWVAGGLGIFVVLASLGEGVLWPTERRLQRVAAATTEAAAVDSAVVHRDAGLMLLVAWSALVLLVAGSVLMLVQP